MNNQLARNHVGISYFDPFDLFKSVKNEFLQLFPLDSIRWKATDGATKNINQLPVSLFAENVTDQDGKQLHKDAFIKFIIVTCISVDEYRTKVRPLLKQWLPENLEASSAPDIHQKQENNVQEFESLPSKPIILLYTNTNVVESNLFKNVSVHDKINKDFPKVQLLELKSVYKSVKEKEAFWHQLRSNIKQYLLKILQQRLNVLNKNLSLLPKTSKFKEKTLIREQLLDLYLKFNLKDEGSLQLQHIEDKLVKLEKEQNTIIDGVIEYPLQFKLNDTIGELLNSDTLTKFFLNKFIFVSKLELLQIEEFKTKHSILVLYRTTIQFLRNIETLFEDDSNLVQFKTSVLDFVVSQIPDMPESLSHNEVKGELLMLRRDSWLNGVLSTTDFNILYKNYQCNNKGVYKFDSYQDTFKDEETFHQYYINYTREILSTFSKLENKRLRIIDYLTIEIGFLHYQKKEYLNAITLFISCYEYYIQSHWEIIGLEILIVFVDSLVNCPNIKTLDIDGSNVVVSVILCNAYLNLLKLSSSLDDKIKYWNMFLNTRKEDEENNELIYTLDGLLDIEINPFIQLQNANEYMIEFNVNKLDIPENVTIDSIKLTLVNDKQKQVIFSGNEILFSKNKKTYCLTTTEIIFDKFEPQSLQLTLGTSRFLKEFDQTKLKVFIEPICNIDEISVNVTSSRSLELGKHALFTKNSNLNKVESFEWNLSVEPINNTYPIRFEKGENIHEIKISDLSSMNNNFEYFLNEAISSFNIRSELTFVRLNESGEFIKYKEIQYFPIQCYLPVSVSVEDIFKRDAFYFKFLLNSSIANEMIVLYSCQLDSPDQNEYEIYGNYEPTIPLILTSSTDDLSLNCYRIKSKTNQFYQNDVFKLRINYNTLKELLDSLVTDAILLQGDVEWFKQFAKWRKFWLINVLNNLNYDYDLFHKENIIKLDSSTANLEYITKKILTRVSLEDDVVEGIVSCLNKLVEGYTINDMELQEYSQNCPERQLIVPVELPKIDGLFKIKFSMQESLDSVFQAGTPIAFTITAEDISNIWVDSDTVEDTNPNKVFELNDADESRKFVFEIKSSSDWLIQGKKRLTISGATRDNGSIFTHDILLIPVRKGHLLLPAIEVVDVEGNQVRTDQPNAFDTVLVTT